MIKMTKTEDLKYLHQHLHLITMHKMHKLGTQISLRACTKCTVFTNLRKTCELLTETALTRWRQQQGLSQRQCKRPYNKIILDHRSLLGGVGSSNSIWTPFQGVAQSLGILLILGHLIAILYRGQPCQLYSLPSTKNCKPLGQNINSAPMNSRQHTYDFLFSQDLIVPAGAKLLDWQQHNLFDLLEQLERAPGHRCCTQRTSTIANQRNKATLLDQRRLFAVSCWASQKLLHILSQSQVYDQAQQWSEASLIQNSFRNICKIVNSTTWRGDTYHRPVSPPSGS